MKRHVAWAAAVLALGGLVRESGAAERISADNLRQNLFGTCLSSPTEGWAVGDLGRIFHTVDGGKSWETQDAGTKRPFASISCIGNKLWAGGQGGQIASSSNGGVNWQMLPSGTDRQILDIAFATDQLGLAVGDFGTIMRTEDGGSTWTKIEMPADIKLPPEIADVVDPGDVLLYSVAFGDPQHIWVAGEFGVIIASTDGGQTWQQQTSGVESTLFGAGFGDNQHGWVVGLDSILLMTNDGGQTWTKQQIESPKGFSLSLYDVAVNGNYGWAVGNSGFLLHTKDAGRTWELVEVPVKMASNWFRAVSMLPDGRGFVVGARGLVLATDREKFTALKQNY